VINTKVRSLIVARWFLNGVRELPGPLWLEDAALQRDEVALAHLIENRTRGLPDGHPTDPPADEDGTVGTGVPRRSGPSGLAGGARPPEVTG